MICPRSRIDLGTVCRPWSIRIIGDIDNGLLDESFIAEPRGLAEVLVGPSKN
jgi:hypothetical protein